MSKPALDLSTLTADEDPAIGDELRRELDRRLERLDRDGPVGVAWEDVYAEMKTADEL